MNDRDIAYLRDEIQSCVYDAHVNLDSVKEFVYFISTDSKLRKLIFRLWLNAVKLRLLQLCRLSK